MITPPTALTALIPLLTDLVAGAQEECRKDFQRHELDQYCDWEGGFKPLVTVPGSAMSWERFNTAGTPGFVLHIRYTENGETIETSIVPNDAGSVFAKDWTTIN